MAISAAQKHVKMMWAELDAALECDLVGVVRGQVGAARSPGDPQWELMIDLKPWRMGTQPARNTMLTARKHVGKGDIASLTKKLPAGAVVTMKAQVVVKGVCSWPQARVSKIILIGTDRSALGGRAAKAPPPLKDPLFGTFKPAAIDGNPTAKILWGGKRIPISLQDDKRGSSGPALDHARKLASRHESWRKDVDRFLLAKVFPQWLKAWKLVEDKPLTEQQWLKRIKPRSVEVQADGVFYISHDDSDLFGGHHVVVQGKVGRGIQDFDLIG